MIFLVWCYLLYVMLVLVLVWRDGAEVGVGVDS